MLNLNPSKSKFLGSSTNLPFEDNSFDIVVAANLLHHLTKKDRIKTLLEMKRVARFAIVSFEPNRNNPFMFLFSLCKKEERMALKFSRKYMKNIFKNINTTSCKTHVEGWTVPNKSPIWWLPISKILNKTPIRRLGFYICTIGTLPLNTNSLVKK